MTDVAEQLHVALRDFHSDQFRCQRLCGNETCVTCVRKGGGVWRMPVRGSVELSVNR